MSAEARLKKETTAETRGGLGGKPARRIVFVGNPNSGKTTLFNRLTGLRAKTSNFPGTTVELRHARRMHGATEVEYVDLPGLYGLAGGSGEERVAADYLAEISRDSEIRTLAILVVDGTRLARNLFLVSQVREIVGEAIVVLTMSDLAAREGLSFDTEELGKELGAPVLQVSARTGTGVSTLCEAISDWVGQLSCAAVPSPPCAVSCSRCDGCPHVTRFRWAEGLTERVARKSGATATRKKLTERLDPWLTHPATGLVAFFVVMGFLFQALFWMAEVPMGWIDDGFVALREAARAMLPEAYWSGLIVDGLLTGIAGTAIFLPQICILFFLISIVEDSGYLARAALVADRWMARVGLPGKAFVPILSAHACAIPAVMSTRAMESPRDRLVTTLILPLFTCSARIPVYVMVTAMLFPHSPGKAGLMFAGAYFLGMFAAFGFAFVLKGSLFRGQASPLLIELPDYKAPSLRTALLTSFDRGLLFLRRAGVMIVCIVVTLWALAQFPVMPEDLRSAEAAAYQQTSPEEMEAGMARAQLEYSLVGRIGKGVQPVFAPLGFDWTITVGVITSFAAREVVASTLSVLYGLSEDGADAPESIAERLRDNIPPASGLSLLVFFVLAMQCLPTVVVTRRETGSWRWPLLQLASMSGLAYIAAMVTYQVASRLM